LTDGPLQASWRRTSAPPQRPIDEVTGQGHGRRGGPGSSRSAHRSTTRSTTWRRPRRYRRPSS